MYSVYIEIVDIDRIDLLYHLAYDTASEPFFFLLERCKRQRS